MSNSPRATTQTPYPAPMFPSLGRGRRWVRLTPLTWGTGRGHLLQMFLSVAVFLLSGSAYIRRMWQGGGVKMRGTRSHQLQGNSMTEAQQCLHCQKGLFLFLLNTFNHQPISGRVTTSLAAESPQPE